MTVIAPPRPTQLPLAPEHDSKSQAAKTEQRKEEAAGQCYARPAADDAAMRRFAAACSDGGGLTLEQRLQSVWEGLSAAGAAPCPVCGGQMHRDIDAATCRNCGSTLT